MTADAPWLSGRAEVLATHVDMAPIASVPGLRILVIARRHHHASVAQGSQSDRQAIHGLAQATSLGEWSHFTCDAKGMALKQKHTILWTV